VIGRVVGTTRADTQVGGGIRDAEAVAALLEIGVSRVVVGTRAVDDPEWLQAVADRFPGRLVVAADIRDGVVLRKGWTEGSGLALDAFLERLQPLPLAGVLCTDVSREGRMKGIDRDGVARALRDSTHPMWISGGVTTMDELDFLADSGAAGVVLGMALYRGVLDPEAVAAKYGGAPDGSGGPSGHKEPAPGTSSGSEYPGPDSASEDERDTPRDHTSGGSSDE
jgi:phosphoribosylformimino-5-aminoimidazole carboxamide ribotide isomerase